MSYDLQRKKKNKKHVQSMAYSSVWSDGRADDHIAQQQLSPLLFVPTVFWS